MDGRERDIDMQQRRPYGMSTWLKNEVSKARSDYREDTYSRPPTVVLRVAILEEERLLMGIVAARAAIKNGRRDSKSAVESMAGWERRGMSRWGRRCCY